MGCIPSTSAHSNVEPARQPALKGGAHGVQNDQQPPNLSTRNGDHAHKQQQRVNTAVLRQANVFDQLHEQAHKEPSLRRVKVQVGQHNQRLLHGFEEKERQAREKPRLQNVQSSDLRSSKLFDKLQEFELNDQRVRMEPKLQNSFQQRQNEMQRAGAAAAAAAAADAAAAAAAQH